jgi:hypothetical protein
MGAHCSIAERGKTELSRASEASNQQINPAMPTEGHPYLYTGCNPINLTDSSGLASRDPALRARPVCPFLAWPSRPYRLWEHRMTLQQ